MEPVPGKGIGSVLWICLFETVWPTAKAAKVVELGVSERCELFGCSAAALTGLAVDEDRATLIGQGLCSRLGADLVDRQQHGVCQMAGDLFLFVADIHDRSIGM